MKIASWVRLALGLVALRLVLMATMPVFEPSEARYAAISANMARSGDFVVPHFTHNLEYQSFDGKPPLVFQAGGLFCRCLGVNEFSVRLFPFLSALLVLAILYHSLARRSDRATAWLGVAVCATSTAFYVASGVSMTDMTLTCCVAGALLLYRTFIDESERIAVVRGSQSRALAYAAAVMALMGAGMIVKGPVALVMFGLPAVVDAAVNRRWRMIFNWRWLAALPIFMAVAVPWFVLIEQRNPGSVAYFFYNENFLRFVSHDYGDRYGAGREAFRGVSILWAMAATLPWSLLPLAKGFARWRASGWRTALAAVRPRSFEFCAAMAIVGFWCLTSRVLVYYLFPMIPLFAAWLALCGPRQAVMRMLMPSAVITALATVAALAGGMAFSDKMAGAKTPFEPLENHYAYEFYHGRPSDELLAKAREFRAQYEERRRLRHAARALKAKKEGEQ